VLKTNCLCSCDERAGDNTSLILLNHFIFEPFWKSAEWIAGSAWGPSACPEAIAAKDSSTDEGGIQPPEIRSKKEVKV
jgi:hypothetical protein